MYIKFLGPALSQVLVYLISRSFQKITQFKSMCARARVCVCVCVRARAYVYVCINVTSQNNVIVVTCKTRNRILLFQMWRNFKSSESENLKNLSLIHDAKLYLLEMFLYFLVD